MALGYAPLGWVSGRLEAAQERGNHDDKERGREEDSRRDGNHVDGVGADPEHCHCPCPSLE